ncbi:MAG: RNA-binding protein [Spirochaetia bacterium]|nr:RNA-binding protein [Spirochaetia bacterium]
MDQETRLSPTQEDVTAGKLQLLAAKVKVDSQPEELEALKKAFKKNVPFTQRGNVSAFLLREYLQLNTPKKSSSSSSDKRKAPAKKPITTKASASPVAKAAPVVKNIPEGSRTIYINIGKMRRLYAKELSQILVEKLEIEKEAIYSIRVHDKYSFVTLDGDTAEKAIEVLNGVEIRGRVASVSYSNKE